MTKAELGLFIPRQGAFGGVVPGDAIEMHRISAFRDAQSGEGLGACLRESCAKLDVRGDDRVTTNFADFDFDGIMVEGRPQPKALPRDTGLPVEISDSTTGPSFPRDVCSPLKVTWSVRPPPHC